MEKPRASVQLTTVARSSGGAKGQGGMVGGSFGGDGGKTVRLWAGDEVGEHGLGTDLKPAMMASVKFGDNLTAATGWARIFLF
ncbi:hypothetical protein M0R45_016053 [Rubus argutus]|uniref:Uncharacterized protein n=1 Tax=Rubus argutus TaxID=59490 RepID=A0AAW1XST1_RUBAR